MSKRIAEAACELAKVDEQFRRDLLAALKSIGRGQRGARIEAGRVEHILTAYRAALRILEQSGARPTTAAAVRMLVNGPFPEYEKNPTSLERLIRKHAQK